MQYSVEIHPLPAFQYAMEFSSNIISFLTIFLLVQTRISLRGELLAKINVQKSTTCFSYFSSPLLIDFSRCHSIRVQKFPTIDQLRIIFSFPLSSPITTKMGEAMPNSTFCRDGSKDADINDLFPALAIVGLGLRLPGNIHSAESLWELLMEKKDTRGAIPSDRYNVDGFYSTLSKPGCVGVQHGHFLSENDGLQHMDTSFFKMSKAEVENLDPQQRMLLEVVWECMENGGQVGWRGGNIGCFAGVWGGVKLSSPPIL